MDDVIDLIDSDDDDVAGEMYAAPIIDEELDRKLEMLADSCAVGDSETATTTTTLPQNTFEDEMETFMIPNTSAITRKRSKSMDLNTTNKLQIVTAADGQQAAAPATATITNTTTTTTTMATTADGANTEASSKINTTTGKNISPSTGRQRHRKSPIRTLGLSPTLEFQTIILDDEETTTSNHSDENTIAPIEREPPTTSTNTAIAIVQPNVTRIPIGKKYSNKMNAQPNVTLSAAASKESQAIDDRINAVATRFIEQEEIMKRIRSMAETRMRVNKLLQVFGMPKIDFSVSTHTEMLRFQFRDRLKQYKQEALSQSLTQRVRAQQQRQLFEEAQKAKQRLQQQKEDMDGY